MNREFSDTDARAASARFRPLDGLLVLAVEQAVAAPLCTSRLADAGATVIKIERPEGDFARRYDEAALGDSSYFAWINHGKQSVVLDFKAPEDAAWLHRMLAKADVFVQNLAPGAMQRAGFGSDALRERYSRLITCDISGYGDGEALAGMKAYDLLVQAESGLISVSGAPGAPGRIGVSLCDIGAGVTAHAGVLEALLQRGITGRGSGLAVSLFDVAAEWMSVPLVHAETGSGAPPPVGLKHPSIAPYGAFADRDARLTLISIQNEREWLRLCEHVLRRPDLPLDTRFMSNLARVAHRDALDEQIESETRLLDGATLHERLRDASIAFGALNDVDALAGHPALRRRSVSNSSGSPVSLPAHPVQLRELKRDSPVRELRVAHTGHDGVSGQDQAGWRTGHRCVPRLGEHTEALRRAFD